jgi:hypothetical protein
MTVTGASAPVARVADALEARRDELVGAAWEAIASPLPAYRDAGPDTLPDVREHSRTHHDLLCAVLRRGRPPERRELDFAGRQAARRARHPARGLPRRVPLLPRHRGPRWSMPRAMLGRRRRDALAAAGTLLLYVDVATEEAGGAYLEAQQLLVADSDRAPRPAR